VILAQYQADHNKPLKPVNRRSKQSDILPEIKCPHCGAPHDYIYYNDGKKRTQLKCKVCEKTFQILKPFRKSKTGFHCPHCYNALFEWRKREMVTIYKCSTKTCPYRLDQYKKLNAAEKLLQKMAPSNFRITYQFREYHFTPQQIQHATPTEPKKTKVDLFKIHKSDSLVGLILTFYVSFALSARKTAYLIREVFNIPVSYQTVLNYAQAAACYAHQFNLTHKGPIDDISVGDETYIKISAQTHYVWFVLSAKKHSVTAYHLADNRGTISAVAALNEAIATADSNQEMTVITDGHPAYVEAIHFINKARKERQQNKIKHIQVIGLKNQDEISEEYRPFKQIIERFNRTYKHHVRPSAGFNAFNGAMALTTLFVTHYNFLRPHTSLGHRPPIHIEQLENINTIQGRWTRLLSMMI